MRACIFDLDGTLLDSMGVWTRIDVDFLTKRGIPVPPDYADAVGALSFQEAAEYTIHRFALPDSARDLMREWSDMAMDAYGYAVPLKPGAREYLMALKARGVRLGVATSLSRALLEPALRNNGVFGLFDAICTTDEVGCGKSRPDVFERAAQKLGVDPKDCVVFEDIPQAILSAKQAGMRVYGVYDDASKAHWAEIRRIADGAIENFVDAPLPETLEE